MVYAWVLGDGTSTQPIQQRIRYTIDDIDRFVDVNDLSAGPAVGSNFTLLVDGLVPDPMARCLCVTMFNANSGTARGLTVRIRGLNQFGVNVEENVVFADKAINTTNITFTRNAFFSINNIQYVARTGGAVQANDRVDVGMTCVAGTAAGTFDSANGSASTDYKAFGIAVPLSSADGLGTVVAADFPTQVHGTILTEDGTSGVQTWAAMSRANDFKVDTTFSTLTPDEEFVAALGAGASNIEAFFTYSLNTRRTETGNTVPSVPLV